MMKREFDTNSCNSQCCYSKFPLILLLQCAAAERVFKLEKWTRSYLKEEMTLILNSAVALKRTYTGICPSWSDIFSYLHNYECFLWTQEWCTSLTPDQCLNFWNYSHLFDFFKFCLRSYLSEYESYKTFSILFIFMFVYLLSCPSCRGRYIFGTFISSAKSKIFSGEFNSISSSFCLNEINVFLVFNYCCMSLSPIF